MEKNKKRYKLNSLFRVIHLFISFFKYKNPIHLMSLSLQVLDWKRWGLLIYVVPQSYDLYVAAVKN